MSPLPRTDHAGRRDLPRALLRFSAALACASAAQPVIVLAALVADVATGGAWSTDRGKAAELVDANSLWIVAVAAWAASLGVTFRRRWCGAPPYAAPSGPQTRRLAAGVVVLGLAWLVNAGVSQVLVEEWSQLPSGQSHLEYRAQCTPAPVTALVGIPTRSLTLGSAPSMRVVGLATTKEGQVLSFEPGAGEALRVAQAGPAESSPGSPFADQPVSALDATTLCGGRQCAIQSDGRGHCARSTGALAWTADADLGTDIVAITAAFGCAGCAAAKDGVTRCFMTLIPGLERQSSVVSGLVAATRLASTESRGCGIQQDGALVCWALDPSSPELALNGTRPLGGVRVVDVAVAPPHACAVTAQATILCWG